MKIIRDDNFFMNLAINIARRNRGMTGVNPSVGCVVVSKNKTIISKTKLRFVLSFILKINAGVSSLRNAAVVVLLFRSQSWGVWASGMKTPKAGCVLLEHSAA